MNPFTTGARLATRLAAAAVHAVVTEYRRLDAPSTPAPARTEQNCTQASTQVSWQPTTRASASARAEDGHPIGFGK